MQMVRFHPGPQAGALELIMGHEQRKFTSQNTAINKGDRPQYAYEIERQAGIVATAQAERRLLFPRNFI